MEGGVNLYAYAGNNPIAFTDPFGLCPESQRDKNGLCPGGLSVDQWQKIEKAANHNMSAGARDRVMRLLNAGKVHPGLTLIDKVIGALKGGSPAASTSPITKNVHVAPETFDYTSGELAFVMAHESQHTVESLLISNKRAEKEADEYGCANTTERGAFENGSYPELGGCTGR
jgi:hypothetical protein